MDLVSFTVNNVAGNRVDYYVRRTVDYSIDLLADGRARLNGEVTFRNDAPSDVAPDGSLAPGPDPLKVVPDIAPGDVFQQAVITCAGDCRLRSASIGGEAFPMTAHTLDDAQAFSGLMRIRPQRSRTVRFSLDLGYGWKGDGAQGTYSLSLPMQPLINPTSTSVSIHAPDGMSFAASTPRMTANGSSAVWHGSLSDAATFHLRFERSALGRIWWDALHLI
jgi:hypothetical protein